MGITKSYNTVMYPYGNISQRANSTLCPTPSPSVGLPAVWGQRFVNKTTIFKMATNIETADSSEEEISNFDYSSSNKNDPINEAK